MVKFGKNLYFSHKLISEEQIELEGFDYISDTVLQKFRAAAEQCHATY